MLLLLRTVLRLLLKLIFDCYQLITHTNVRQFILSHKNNIQWAKHGTNKGPKAVISKRNVKHTLNY